MRMVWVVAVLVAGLAGAVLAWSLGFARGGDVHPDTVAEVAAFHQLLKDQGIASTVGRVRNTSANVRARHLFELKQAPHRRFYVLWCQDEAAAAKEAKGQGTAPPWQWEAKGRMVLYLPEPPAGDATLERVREAFRSFDAKAAAR
jgi:hypothetical protein